MDPITPVGFGRPDSIIRGAARCLEAALKAEVAADGAHFVAYLDHCGPRLVMRSEETALEDPAQVEAAREPRSGTNG